MPLYQHVLYDVKLLTTYLQKDVNILTKPRHKHANLLTEPAPCLYRGTDDRGRWEWVRASLSCWRRLGWTADPGSTDGWYTRHGELAPVLNGPRPPWVALARTIRDDADWTGNEAGPSRQAVRDTWLRVEKDKATGAASAPPSRAAPASVESPSTPSLGVAQVARPQQDEDMPAFVEPRHRFIGKPAIDRARLPKKE